MAGVLLVSAVAATALRAAESVTAQQASETFWGLAERFGLWAALCVGLVGASVYWLYRQQRFVQETLVQLVKDNQRCLDRVSAALQDAPCGRSAEADYPLKAR